MDQESAASECGGSWTHPQPASLFRGFRRAGQHCPYRWLGYLPLEGRQYRHEITYLKGNSKTGSELMPRVHCVVALVKRWLLGTYQEGVSMEHLDAYLDEFTCQFNRCKSRSRGKLFYRLLEHVSPSNWRPANRWSKVQPPGLLKSQDPGAT